MSPFFAHARSKAAGSTFDDLAYWTLLLFTFLLPVVFVPSPSAPFLLTKLYVGGMLVFAALLFFSLARLKAQDLTLPLSLALASAWLVPLAYLISALMQSGSNGGFFGERIAMDSPGFMLIAVVAFTLTALVLNTRERILGVYTAFLASAAVLAVLELLIFFAQPVLGMLGVGVPSISLVGGLDNLGMFYGLLVVLCLVSLARLPLTTVLRSTLWGALAVSLFFLAVVNLPLLWWLIGLFALAAFVFSLFAHAQRRSTHADGDNSLSVAALLVLVLSVLFVVGSPAITGTPARWANVGELGVRPAWQTTMNIGGQVYKESALVGSGPGTFASLWSKYRPQEVDQTRFWSIDFVYGIGILPTSFITVGIIGVIAWLVFYGFIVVAGVRRLVFDHIDPDAMGGYLRISAFLATAYLLTMLVVQIPSPALVFYTFLFAGLFIATLRVGKDATPVLMLAFKDNPRVGFLATLLFTLAILGSAAGMYELTTRYSGEIYFQRGLRLANAQGNIDGAHAALTQAVTLNEVDAYYQALTNLELVRLQRLVAQNKPPEEVRDEFQNILSTAINNAQRAVQLGANNYQNYITLAGVYQSIVPLGIDGAAENAQKALDKALELRPNAPTILLAKAALARAQAQPEEARKYAEAAIAARNVYTDAIFLLAQLQIEANQMEDAVRSVRATTLLDPQNPVVYFQLGLLQYSMADFAGATESLGRAVSLNQQYANARYFLGLALFQLGRRDEALAQFEQVRTTNPENQDLILMIENLRAGRNPFAATTTPEQVVAEAETLPVNEQESTASSTEEVPPELTR